LGARRFAANTPFMGYWISLDFLGFSRQNRDFSMGYKGFSAYDFSMAFAAPEREPKGLGMRRGRIVHEASLI
jgi:hypothetical protein